ncbi:MAG: amino acid permease [Acidobacteria bacterium]|nr:amino acid permease [Acidobacteriota bacterium]
MSRSRRNEGLVRNLGVIGAGAFVVTNMVGSGIFTLPAIVRVNVGGAVESLAVWAAAGLLGICGALCYAELATRMPDAGGEYRYLEAAFGPLWAFLSGWTSFVVGFSAAVAASALGFAAYVDPLLPGWQADASIGFGVQVSQGSLFAALIVLGLTAIHSVGVRSSGRFQSGLAIAVVCTVWALVVIGFATRGGSAVGLTASAPAQGSWWAALLPVSYAYAGWNAAAYMGGEVRDPGRTLPRAIIGGCAFVMLTYLFVNALFFYAIPEAQWEPTIAVGQVAAERLFGAQGAIGISAVIALAMFASVSAMTAVGPRIYFAMARDGLAPAALARLSEQGKVPVTAIVAQGVLAALLALTGAFEALLIYIGSSLLLFNALTIATLFVFRRRAGEAPAFTAPAFPLPAIVFLAITVAAWVSGLIATPGPTIAALATLSGGAAVYAVGRNRGWFVTN